MLLHKLILNNSEYIAIRDTILDNADINSKDHDGDTPLHLAIMEDLDSTIIKSLLDSMANVHIQNNSHETPLTLVQGYASDDAVINLVLTAYNNVFNETWFQDMQQYQLSNNLQDNEEVSIIMGNILEIEQWSGMTMFI